MDALSFLIEGNSTCTALTVINNKLYIAANEFCAKTRVLKNNKIKFIEEIFAFV